MKSMQKFLLASALGLLVSISPIAFGQIVSSGMTGIITSPDGQPVSGATLTAVHTPTNASFTATTRPDGRYQFRGLPVGGPFSVTARATGYDPTTVGGIETQLGEIIDVNVTIKSDVIVLEEFVATGRRTDLDSSASGSGNILTAEHLAAKPTSERSLADMISATPFVTLRSTFGDREASQITAVGQNNRHNSIQIDGARINDQFGLNATGLFSFFNPLSLDTIEQLSVHISPYDVRQAGFTGASVNAVTKSGTNTFKGTVYTYFRGNELFGMQLQGPNARDLVLSGTRIIPKLDRMTWGATFGGPIIKDKLFFFLSYEDFESTSTGRDPRFAPANEAQILTRLAAYASTAGKTINWGNPVTGQTSNTVRDEKIIGKIDWHINSDHRLSVRYTSTEGEVPQFGTFASATGNIAGVAGGIIATPDGHFFSQQRKEEAYAAQLFSQWTPDFKTEVKYSTTKQGQLTPLNTVGPVVYITGVSGTDLLNNTSVTTGSYMAGTEQFRHGNVISVEPQQMSITGDYFLGNFVISGGVEREQTDFYNLFRQGSYGLVAFRNMTDFLNDTNVVIQRNVFDPTKRMIADISDFATNGIFLQAKWEPTRRLSTTLGVRYEFAESDATPTFNAPLFAATGFRNTGTPDGSSSVSPRFGFNLALNDARTTQLRGGYGHFLGRAPWVLFSNSFGDTGVGSFAQFNTGTNPALPATLTAYLRDQFNPADPIGKATDDGLGRRVVSFADEGIAMPQVWRGNLAVDHKLDFLNSTVSVEIVHTTIDEALFIRNENLKPLTSPAADGRKRFSGNPGTTASALYAGFTDLYRLRNVQVGESTYFTLSWDRPMRDKWAMNVAYTRGKATEAQNSGDTIASGLWQRQVVFNQGDVEEGTADFEIKDRIQATYTRRFEFVKNWPTTMSLYYEGRTGNPYSWVYSTDLNGDGRSDNDRVAVPDSVSDARFDFSGMTVEQRDSYFAFLESSGLSAYGGGIAPKNSFSEPWVNRLDLKFSQKIPIYKPAELELFFDFINFGSFLSDDIFGYVETAPAMTNEVFRRRFLGGASYDNTNGKIRPTFTSTPTGFNIDNGMSRWRIQLGARLKF